MDLLLVISRLSGTYGAEAYATVDLAEWKADLNGILSDEEALTHAFLHLPLKAPDSRAFRSLCESFRRSPELPVNKGGDKEFVHSLLRNMARPMPKGPKAWAHALRDREQSGERLTPFQRSCWRDALGPPPAGSEDA